MHFTTRKCIIKKVCSENRRRRRGAERTKRTARETTGVKGKECVEPAADEATAVASTLLGHGGDENVYRDPNAGGSDIIYDVIPRAVSFARRSLAGRDDDTAGRPTEQLKAFFQLRPDTAADPKGVERLYFRKNEAPVFFVSSQPKSERRSGY